MTLEKDIPGFAGTNVRSDRLQVQPYEADHAEMWAIVPHDDRPTLTTCPCCGKLFETSKAAKLIASIARAFGLDRSRISKIIVRERKNRQMAAEAAAREAREREAERVPGKFGGYRRIVPDEALRAEIAAAKREAPFALPFKGRID